MALPLDVLIISAALNSIFSGHPIDGLLGLRPAPVCGAVGGQRGPVQLGHQASGIQRAAHAAPFDLRAAAQEGGRRYSESATTASAFADGALAGVAFDQL